MLFGKQTCPEGKPILINQGSVLAGDRPFGGGKEVQVKKKRFRIIHRGEYRRSRGVFERGVSEEKFNIPRQAGERAAEGRWSLVRPQKKGFNKTHGNEPTWEAGERSLSKGPPPWVSE